MTTLKWFELAWDDESLYANASNRHIAVSFLGDSFEIDRVHFHSESEAYDWLEENEFVWNIKETL